MPNLRTRKTLRTREHRAFVSVIVASRKEAELTQEQLAKEVSKISKKNADKTWISRFESGDRVLGAVELMWLAAAMKMEPEMLMARVSKWLETTK